MDVLTRCVAAGDCAVLVYCVQRDGVQQVQPADHIDPDYGRALRAAQAQGVEVYALAARVEDHALTLYRSVPVFCPPL